MTQFNKQYTALPYTLSDFDFDLPTELIAQMPAPTRTQSRLLRVKGKQLQDSQFSYIIDDFVGGDVLVVNNTKVIPARLFGSKVSGGKLEIFVERIQSPETALCMIKANRPPKIGSEIFIADSRAVINDRKGMFFVITLQSEEWSHLTADKGDIPLPPYIHRQTTDDDINRYQTVYAKENGAVAAPTAGLHFDDNLLQTLKDKGVEIVEVTLHVGAGTFQPVKAENLDEHIMHFELFEISDNTREIINRAKRENRRITAVGTTSMRALESAAHNGELLHSYGDTNLFIRPGYQFEIVDRLITNFHLPKSSLMMLVSAFAGYENIKLAYAHAIEQKYRFFSYGDAMMLDRDS